MLKHTLIWLSEHPFISGYSQTPYLADNWTFSVNNYYMYNVKCQVMVITRSLEHPKLVELPGDEPQPYKPFQVLVPHKVRHVLTLSYYIVIPPIPPLRSPPPPHYRRPLPPLPFSSPESNSRGFSWLYNYIWLLSLPVSDYPAFSSVPRLAVLRGTTVLD